MPFRHREVRVLALQCILPARSSLELLRKPIHSVLEMLRCWDFPLVCMFNWFV